MAGVQREVTAAWMRRRLLGWYDRHRRRLPWRAAEGRRAEAYRVWVSEIMLQQTRVAAVVPYYERFLRRFPDVAALATAGENEILGAWSGLGYYRRARYLHAAAREIVTRHAGAFPREPAAALALPGIGAYTAAAILSIAYGQPLAAVDGNGWRIACRLAGGKRTMTEARVLWSTWLAPRRAGDFNQAVMDLGATVCVPRQPACEVCPLRQRCHGRGRAVPVERRMPARRIERHYALIQSRGRVWLRRRPAEEAQMPGLWELPPLARPSDEPWDTFRHTITNSIITAHVYLRRRTIAGGQWMNRGQALSAPLTGLARKILAELAWAPDAAAAADAAGLTGR